MKSKYRFSTQNIADPLDNPIEPVSLVDEVADRLRMSIVQGTLKPGGEINESQLAERLGVARGTLREAVRILSGEGLIEKLPNRVSRVSELSLEKAWEIITTRAVIEGFAARVLAQRLTPGKVDELYQIWQNLYDAANANDQVTFSQWDFVLHQAIMEMSGHGVLFETWTKIGAWIRLIFASKEYTPEELITNAVNHKKIIEAIASGDPDRAERQLKADLFDEVERRRFAEFPEPWPYDQLEDVAS